MASVAVATKLFEIYSPWSNGVARTAVRRIGAKAEIGELQSIAAAKTWERLLAFQPHRWQRMPQGDPFEVFAWPTVYGACLQAGFRGLSGRAQSSAGEYFVLESIDEATSLAGQSADIDGAIDRHRKRELLADAIGLLPDQERRVLTEHYFGEISLSEIAAALYTSPSSVSRIHANGLRLMREMLRTRGLVCLN
jgi:RNA polymerase sigma factor (sigma-70 family)